MNKPRQSRKRPLRRKGSREEGPRETADIQDILESVQERLQQSRSAVAQAQQAQAKEKEWRIPFDPLDPVALLEARRKARARQATTNDFKASIEVIDEERLVPISYNAAYLAKREQQAMEKKKLKELHQRQAVKFEALEQIRKTGEQLKMDEKKRAAAERFEKEGRRDSLLVARASVKLNVLLPEIRKVDPFLRGNLNVDTFREIVQRMRGELEMTTAEIDRLISLLANGDRITYDTLFHTSQQTVTEDKVKTKKKKKEYPVPLERLTNSKSAPEILKLHTLETAKEYSHNFGSPQRPSQDTRHLLRPQTGAEGYFPDSERLQTTARSPVKESLLSFRKTKNTAKERTKALRLQNHLGRIQRLSDWNSLSAMQCEVSRERSIARQRQDYLSRISGKALGVLPAASGILPGLKM